MSLKEWNRRIRNSLGYSQMVVFGVQTTIGERPLPDPMLTKTKDAPYGTPSPLETYHLGFEYSEKNTLLGGTYVLPPTAREPPRAWGKIYRKITYLFWHNNKRRVWFDYAYLLNRGRWKPWCTQIFRWKLSFFSIRLLVVKKRNIKSSLVSLLRLQEFFTKDTYIIFFDAASISDICFAKKKKKSPVGVH